MSLDFGRLRELAILARERALAKNAFVDPSGLQAAEGGGQGQMPPPGMGGDPSMQGVMGGGGGGGMPMDPSQAAMMGGGGGMPPMDPSMQGMPPGMGAESGQGPQPISADQVQQMIQQALAQQGGGGAGGSGAPRLKVDLNIEILLIKNMLARICDGLNLHIPASELAATPEKVQQMLSSQQSAAGGMAGQQNSSIGPINPIQGASVGGAQGKTASWEDTDMRRLSNKASALASVLRERNGHVHQ